MSCFMQRKETGTEKAGRRPPHGLGVINRFVEHGGVTIRGGLLVDIANLTANTQRWDSNCNRKQHIMRVGTDENILKVFQKIEHSRNTGKGLKRIPAFWGSPSAAGTA